MTPTPITLKEIFKRMKGEWDKFGGVILYDEEPLACYLANKSWCMAVWGHEITCDCGALKYSKECPCDDYVTPYGERYVILSLTAFGSLQQEGQQACLEYILNSMI